MAIASLMGITTLQSFVSNASNVENKNSQDPKEIIYLTPTKGPAYEYVGCSGYYSFEDDMTVAEAIEFGAKSWAARARPGEHMLCIDL